MTEQILPNLYRIQVPLPENPLKSINSYVVRGRDRNLVVDTGMRRPECRAVLSTELHGLGIDLARTDFFITHLHADHMGLIADLATDTSMVYFNRPDAELIQAGRDDPSGFMSRVIDHARRVGFPARELEASLRRHPGLRYSPPEYPPFHHLDEGDQLEVGDHRFTVVSTPGHTPGHQCLYETEHLLLLAGDHVLGDITPNITVWRENDDSLGDYLDNLERMVELKVENVLPGHRSTFTDLQRRIDELQQHHRRRLDEVISILESGSKHTTVYDVASKMTWSIVAKSWQDFPVVQKWFAVSEAAAHLRYLEKRNLVTSERSGEATVFDAT